MLNELMIEALDGLNEQDDFFPLEPTSPKHSSHWTRQHRKMGANSFLVTNISRDVAVHLKFKLRNR